MGRNRAANQSCVRLKGPPAIDPGTDSVKDNSFVLPSMNAAKKVYTYFCAPAAGYSGLLGNYDRDSESVFQFPDTDIAGYTLPGFARAYRNLVLIRE